MIPPLNHLSIVELDRLILHEAHDTNRLARLRRRVESEGLQQNPVIVSAVRGGYLVLDGAHRVQTMREIGCRFILAQVVEPPKKAESWGHVLKDLTPEKLAGASGVTTSEDAKQWIAEIRFASGGLAFVEAGEGLSKEVDALWGLQALYPALEEVRRVETGPVDSLSSLSNEEALVLYRTFTPDELVEIVESGAVLPAGITRFRVSERVLGVKFPLEKLIDGNIEERNKELRTFVKERWDQNRVRHYDEPIVLFE